ncbi:MAG: carbohydrate ABC transporter permease, partial [Maritimibacter sp.]|nr:carbohydrate ABC transporter permease [Maritimibacter sp.]
MAATQDLQIKASSDALMKGGSPAYAPRNMGQILRFLLLLAGGILMVMPIAFMISTSLKWPHEVYNLNFIPEEPTLDNYAYVLEDGR